MIPDLWAAGFSSDEEREVQPRSGSHDLDLLASLVEKREGEATGRRGEGRKNTTDNLEKTTHFEENVTTPDEVSLMKGKLHLAATCRCALSFPVSTGPHTHMCNEGRREGGR